MRTRAQRRWTAFSVALLACALLCAPGQAGAAKSPRVVVKPKPGQQITHHPVRLVVRAGPETGDLRARLNGVAIGRHFLVQRRGRRVLSVSNSHGLHHGRNVLKVVARTRNGTRVRRSTVRFSVAHRRPLAGAGRDRRIVRDSRVELRGRVVEHPKGRSGDRVRWQIVDAPRGSRFGRGSASSSSAKAQSSGLEGANSLTPSFRPDVHGTYTLKMTAGSGAAATSDNVLLHAVHPSPLVEIHTAIPPTTENPRPGIQVGDTIYRAPYLRNVGGVGTYTEPGQNVPHYTALLQVVMLNRTTLELGENVTYGDCLDVGDNASHSCRIGDNGEPFQVDMEDDIKFLSDSYNSPLIIVNSLPGTLSPEAQGWAHDNTYEAALGPLSTIGFPASHAEDGSAQGDIDVAARLSNAPVGSLSMISVLGLDPGEADLAIIPGGGMNGWLTHDNNDLPAYGFVPGAREQFDTRSVSDCDAAADTCTVSQTIGSAGDPDPSQPVQNGQGGYLVSVYDRLTLRRLVADFFFTVGLPSGSTHQVQGMADFLHTYRGAHGENLVVVTSAHTPGQPQPNHLVDASVPTADWSALTDEIVALGGTRHAFNTAASTPGTDYTLIGHGSYRGGVGSEAIGPIGTCSGTQPDPAIICADARFRGALAPDQTSMFAPTNVSAAGAAPEKLLELILREPDQTWPLDDDPGASNALRYIGQFLGIGFDPRAAYWTQSMSASDAGILLDKLQCDVTNHSCASTPRMPGTPPDPPNDFNATDFNHAMGQLIDELGYVQTVRNYLDHLAYPLGDSQATDPWEEAQTLENNLTQQLKNLDDEASVEFDALGLLKSLADVAGLLLGVPDAGTLAASAAKAMRAVATATEFAKVFVDADYGGEPGAPIDSGNIQANKLGERLQAEAQATATSFKRMGDIIVSDWSKLQELGKNGRAGCNPVPGGCDEGYEEYGWTGAIGTSAADATETALEQTIHQHLVPGEFAFPVWNTGVSAAPCDQPCIPPDPVQQSDCGYYNPFNSAPRLAWFQALEVLDPSGVSSRWRTWLSLARSGLTYGWASDDLLRRMFDPHYINPDTDPPHGLYMSPADFFPSARPPYDGGGECSWSE